MMAQAKSETEFLAQVMEAEKKTDHLCWQCQHFKWVIKDSKLPPADIIGWCKKIHWPFFWCVNESDVVKECYGYEQRK